MVKGSPNSRSFVSDEPVKMVAVPEVIDPETHREAINRRLATTRGNFDKELLTLNAHQKALFKHNNFRNDISKKNTLDTLLCCAEFCAAALQHDTILEFLLPFGGSNQGLWNSDGTVSQLSKEDVRVLRQAHHVMEDTTVKQQLGINSREGLDFEKCRRSTKFVREIFAFASTTVSHHGTVSERRCRVFAEVCDLLSGQRSLHSVKKTFEQWKSDFQPGEVDRTNRTGCNLRNTAAKPAEQPTESHLPDTNKKTTPPCVNVARVSDEHSSGESPDEDSSASPDEMNCDPLAGLTDCDSDDKESDEECPCTDDLSERNKRRRLVQSPGQKASKKQKKKNTLEQRLQNPQARRKHELHMPVGTETDFSKGVQRKKFHEGLREAGASVHEGTASAKLLFEVPRKEINEKTGELECLAGTPGPSHKVDLDIIQQPWVLGVGPGAICCFEDSGQPMHGMLDGNATVESSGLNEVEDMRRFCMEHGCGVNFLGTSLDCTEKQFLQVINHGGELCDSVMREMEVDAPAVIRDMLCLCKMGEIGGRVPGKGETTEGFDNLSSLVRWHDQQCRSSGSDEDPSADGESGVATIHAKPENCESGARGTIHFDMGFGNHAHNHCMSAEECTVGANFPTLISLGVNKSEAIQAVQIGLMEASGGVMDAATRAMDEIFRRDDPQFNDPKRTELAGLVFRRAAKARDSRFEASTWTLSWLGRVGEVNKIRHKLKRHRDGPDDVRDSHRMTTVWHTLIVAEGTVCRLALIMCSRRSVGDALEKEFSHFRPAKEMLQKCERLVGVCETMDCDGEFCSEWIDFNCENGKTAGGVRHKWHEAVADNMAWCSTCASATNHLDADCGLSDRNVVESLCCALMTRSSVLFWTVLDRWRRGGARPLGTGDEGGLTKEDESGNLVHRCLEELQLMGLSIEGGPRPRCGCSNNSIGKNKEKDNEEISRSLERSEKVILLANSRWTQAECSDAMAGKTGSGQFKIDHLGEVSLLGFCSIAVHVGLLNTRHAREQSMLALMPEGSKFSKFLRARNCAEPRKTLERLAFMRNEDVRLTENLGCKAARWHKLGEKFAPHKDCVVACQELCRRCFDERGEVVLEWKTVGDRMWMRCNPRLRKLHHVRLDNNDMMHG